MHWVNKEYECSCILHVHRVFYSVKYEEEVRSANTQSEVKFGRVLKAKSS